MNNKINPYSSNWDYGEDCLNNSINPSPHVKLDKKNYKINYNASIPTCNKELIQELWRNYSQSPSKGTVLSLALPQLTKVYALNIIVVLMWFVIKVRLWTMIKQKE